MVMSVSKKCENCPALLLASPHKHFLRAGERGRSPPGISPGSCLALASYGAASKLLSVPLR